MSFPPPLHLLPFGSLKESREYLGTEKRWKSLASGRGRPWVEGTAGKGAWVGLQRLICRVHYTICTTLGSHQSWHTHWLGQKMLLGFRKHMNRRGYVFLWGLFLTQTATKATSEMNLWGSQPFPVWNLLPQKSWGNGQTPLAIVSSAITWPSMLHK